MGLFDFLSRLSSEKQSVDSYGSVLEGPECPDCGEPMVKTIFGWECPNNCGEALSPDDAADIWRSSGKDEDYMFGYSEEKLEES